MPFRCEICGYQFRRSRTLRRHQERRHTDHRRVIFNPRRPARTASDEDWLDEPQCSILLPPPGLSPRLVNQSEPRPDAAEFLLSAPPVVELLTSPTPAVAQTELRSDAVELLTPASELPPPPSPAESPLIPSDLLIAPPSPFADPEYDTPLPSPVDFGDEAYVLAEPSTPKAWLAVATQTDPWSPTRRVRKQLFRKHRRTLKTVPEAPYPAPHPHGLVVDTRDARRLCDCATCVRHNLRVLESGAFDDVPAVPGVRYISLPLPLTTSSAADRQRLHQGLQKRPRATYVVCGCARCGSHRDLARSYREALRLTTPLPPPSPPPPAHRHDSRSSPSPHRSEDVTPVPLRH